MYELQCNILEALLLIIYDNYFYKASDFTILCNFTDTREDNYFYKFKLKHYEETSMFIIDRRPSIIV